MVGFETKYHLNFSCGPQNLSNSSDVAYTSEVKWIKNYEKKKRKRRKKKRVMKGLAAMALADHDHKSSDHLFGQTKSLDSLFPAVYNKPPSETWTT